MMNTDRSTTRNISDPRRPARDCLFSPSPGSRPTTTSWTALLSALAVVLFTGCDSAGESRGNAEVFRVTNGACGEIVFVENLAATFDSALELIEAQKIEQFGRENVSLDVRELGVVASQGEAPAAEFFAIHVLSTATGTHLHSVMEVISSSGDLFHLHWCPD